MTSSYCSHPRLVQMQVAGGSNHNHQSTVVLPSQESIINTNYRSTTCEAGHTLRKAPKNALQHRTISPFIIGQPSSTSIDDKSGAWVKMSHDI
jgi:hypothetical protein